MIAAVAIANAARPIHSISSFPERRAGASVHHDAFADREGRRSSAAFAVRR
jgi:hypothetical protein